MPSTTAPEAFRGGMIAAAIALGVIALLGLVGSAVYVAATRSDQGRDVAERDRKTARDKERERREDRERPARPQRQPPRPVQPDAEKPAKEPPGAVEAPDTPPKETAPTPDEAFAALQKQIAAFKADNDRNVAWPPDPNTGLVLFPLDQKYAEVLDATLVVGTRQDFSVTPIRAATPGWRWDFKVGNDCLASLELTGGNVVMKRGDAPEQIWTRHETLLRGMPIVFARPGQRPSADGMVTATAEIAVQPPAGPTLHELLCAEGGAVDVPTLDGALADATIGRVVPRPGDIPIDDSALALRLVTTDAGKAWLAITATIDDRECTLVEPIVFDHATGSVRRQRGSWMNRRSRLAFLRGATTPDEERRRIAAGQGGAVLEARDTMPDIVMALLADGYRGRIARDEVTQVLAAWSGTADGEDIDFGNHPTLGDWRKCLLDHVTRPGGTFTAWVAPRIGNADAPDRDPSPEDVKRQAADPAVLRQFLESQPRPADPRAIDPDSAAVHTLVELDGFLLIKSQREKIEAVLERVPVAALFAGDATLRWTIDGLGDVSVPVRLLPADIPPGPPEPRPVVPSP